MVIKSANGTVIAVITNHTEGIRIKPAIIEEAIMENRTVRGYFFTSDVCSTD